MSRRVFRARVGAGEGASGPDVRAELSVRGLRVDRALERSKTGEGEAFALLGKFPWSSVVGCRAVGDACEIEVRAGGGARRIRFALGSAREAAECAEAVFEIGGPDVVERSKTAFRDVRASGGAVEKSGDASTSALVRDLREENALLAEALRAAEASLERALERESVDDGRLDNDNVGAQIKIRNLQKNLEFEQARCAQLREDVEEQRGKIERYRALEEAMQRENEALRKDLKVACENRDRAMRRAETSEVMAAHAKNEVVALESGRVTDSDLLSENAELKREIAIANSAKSTAEEHMKLTLAHLRAARDENVRLTEELLKKTEEHLNLTARVEELEQLIDGATLRENTQSKEFAIALQERNDALNRVKIFEKDVKRLNIEVERLVGRLGDAERAALREKEEIRFECAEQIQEYAMQISKHTASARDAAIEAQKQGNLAHSAQTAKQELEYELHEERRQRMALERQIEAMEAAKQTIADFTADAEASVLRSIEAQREANIEIQRLRMEKHDLKEWFSPSAKASSPKSSSPNSGQSEPWRTQLGATLDLHRTIRGSPTTPSTQTRASWSRVTDLNAGAAFNRRPTPTTQQRLEEIASEISIIKSRRTPVKAALESKFDLQNGPRVTTVEVAVSEPAA